MARRLRLQFEGAVYHVINRGNYRQDVFETADKAKAFERALFEVCARMRWRLHAYVLMKNHYHLAVETPEANLVEGIHWLQTTYATRFNRFRGESGHVFQGRYRALLVEPGAALLRLVNYLHLNPARAKIVEPEQLSSFRWGSLRWLWSKERPPCFTPQEWLKEAGLEDAEKGWADYKSALLAILQNPESVSAEQSEEFCRGWAIGTPAWRKAVAEEYAHLALCPSIPIEELRQLREAQWENRLAHFVGRMGKVGAFPGHEPKGALWKVSVALAMRQTTTATNRWLAGKLAMGAPNSVSHYLSLVKRGRLHIQILET